MTINNPGQTAIVRLLKTLPDYYETANNYLLSETIVATITFHTYVTAKVPKRAQESHGVKWKAKNVKLKPEGTLGRGV